MPFPTLIGTLVNGSVPPELDWLFSSNFSSNDWLEAVALYSPTQLGLGRKRSHATLTGYIPFNKIRDAVTYFLGFSWVDGNNFLRREVPAAHPVFNNLFANEIVECVGMKFVSKAAKPHPWSLPYATYNLARITVAYTQPPYEILSDAQISMASPSVYKGQELRRWTNWSPKPRVDMLEFPGGTILFDAPGEAWDGNPIPALRTLVRAEKSTRKLVWHNVPYEFVMDRYGFMTKIEPNIGKVNSDADFFGKPAHTWLLDDVDVLNSEVYADPIASAAFEGMTRRMDLVFTLTYFNPTNGKAGSTEAGWRLQPAYNGKWYPTTLSLDGSKTVPEEGDFAAMFTAWDA